MNFHSTITTLLNAAGLAADPTSANAAEIKNEGGLVGGNFWMPPQSSTVAPGIDRIFDIITWISIFFFVLIVILMVVFIMKYHRRSHHEKATSVVTHNTPLELTWTIIPLILVIAIFYVGMEGYLDLRRAPAGAYEVNVTAQKWSWQFDHRNGASETGILRIPVGRPVKLLMQSQDVLHACYIPAFRVKQDVVPGRITYLWFECTKPGTYDLFCAEYCGKDHALMHAVVVAQPEAEFEASLKEVADEYKRKPIHELSEYAMSRLYARCSSCHSLDGKTGTGPSWKGMWEDIKDGNVLFTDGTKLADLMGPGKMFETPEDYIQQSILNPQQKIVMNFAASMPTFKGQLAIRQIQAIILALKELDRFDEKGKLKPDAPPSLAKDEPTTAPANGGGSANAATKPAVGGNGEGTPK
jgi:cytochrome c oxidase subunit II